MTVPAILVKPNDLVENVSANKEEFDPRHRDGFRRNGSDVSVDSG